ncbi:MAG TPA: hypothetical protein PLX23_09215 [Candidatus Hydrogenedens sp.]|nr:hypothetical protein [Candidatus Hydrogenedens sp.]
MAGIKYHTNAKTTVQTHKIIKESKETIESLAKQFNLTKATVSEWKHREELTDKSSRPHHIRTAIEHTKIIL